MILKNFLDFVSNEAWAVRRRNVCVSFLNLTHNIKDICLLVKPIIFCYYCDRTFENEKVLIQHQRAKHFKCIVCHKRLGSAHGMMVHVFQVHKQQIDKVPHAKEGRDSFHVDIFGMSNIPQDVIAAKHAERGIF